MKYIILLSVLLTGCASGCREACVFGFGPGNSTFDAIAKYENSTDPCQSQNKPSYCGASSRTMNVYTPNGQKVYVIK